MPLILFVWFAFAGFLWFLQKGANKKINEHLMIVVADSSVLVFLRQIQLINKIRHKVAMCLYRNMLFNLVVHHRCHFSFLSRTVGVYESFQLIDFAPYHLLNHQEKCHYHQLYLRFFLSAIP